MSNKANPKWARHVRPGFAAGDADWRANPAWSRTGLSSRPIGRPLDHG
jgi:hypothetical protein